MVWEGKNAVVTGRKMLGATNPADSAPGTIRGDFAIETGNKYYEQLNYYVTARLKSRQYGGFQSYVFVHCSTIVTNAYFSLLPRDRPKGLKGCKLPYKLN